MAETDVIEKTGSHTDLPDYETLRKGFSWDTARAELTGLPEGGINIAHEAVDRHLAAGKAEKVAIRWLDKDGTAEDITYGDLARRSNRFANVLKSLGVGKGDPVFVLADRVPELYVAALGIFKNGSVFSPMFSAFGPEPIATRMNIGGAKALVTTDRLYKRKVAKVRDELESLEHVLIIPEGEEPEEFEGTQSLPELMAEASDDCEVAATQPEDTAILHFTSGTTGTPKGAIHVHEAVVVHYATAKYALDLREDDMFWCTADPGWVTGTSYGIIAPLVMGATMLVDRQEFDAERWYANLQDHKITVWYTAPTAIRMLMKAGEELPKQYDLSPLRFIASVGEPLNPEAVYWGDKVLGLPIHDNWWQTETGGIMIANYASEPVKPGSMGRPVPGITAAVVHHNEDEVSVIDKPGEEGELALKPGWPSMFRGYLNQEEKYKNSFRNGWYLTGDLAKVDADGYFWFVGRADDVIKTAGHLVGPFEVESALVEHESVAEAAVIGLPDPVSGQVIKGYVTLKPGFEWSDKLEREILGHARKTLGPAISPKTVEYREALPVTRSGKIMRRLLRARELGLPEGDLSTLERGE